MSEKQKILIVDDRRENLVALRHVLRDLEAELVEATSGNQALAATLDHQFALAILDVQMPQMSGYELAEYLREDENTRHMPIIFLTAHSLDEQSVFKGYEAGGIDYIVKPYDPEVMRGKVRLFLEMDSSRRQIQQHRDQLEATVAERTLELRQEVSERKQAQKRTEHLNRVLQSIRRINQLIVREREPEALIREACEILVETRGYTSAWIMLDQMSDEPTMVAMARRNHSLSQDDLDDLRRSWPFCQRHREKQDAAIIMLTPEQDCAGCPVREQHGSGTAVITTFKRGEERSGLMGIMAEAGSEVTEEEQSLLLEVAGDIAFALHDIRISRQHDLFAEIVANSQEAMALVDRQYRYLKVNPSYQRLVGRPQEQIEGHYIVEVLGEELFQNTIKGKLDHCFSGEMVRFENWRNTPDGEPRLLEAIYSPCLDEDGSIYAAATAIRDITEQRRAEEAALAESRLAQKYFDTAGVMMVVIDSEGGVKSINRRGCEVLGYSENEVVGKSWLDNFVPPRVRGQVAPLALALLEGRDDGATYHENPVLTRQGGERLIAWHNTVIRDEAGETVGVLSSGEDVTDLRATEAALHSSAEFLLETGRMARVGGWSVNPEEGTVEWTEVTREIHEVPDDYEPTLEAATAFFHPEDRLRLEEAINAALTKGEPYDLEVRFTSAEDRQLWTHTRCRPVMEGGKVVKLVGTFQDITERKQAEDLVLARMRLREYGVELSSDGFRQKALDEICALTNSPIGFFHLLAPSRNTVSLHTWSTRTVDEFCRVTEGGPHRDLDQAGMWAECVHRRESMIYNDFASMPGRKGLPPGHAELQRMLTFPLKRGEEIVAVLGIGNKERDYTERDEAVVSFLADVAYEIIVRKRAESEREQLAAAIEQSGDTVVITDPQGSIQYVNPAFSRISGYSQQEVLGQTPRLLKSGEQGEAFYQELWKAISSGRSWEGRIVNKRKDGSLYTEESRISPVFDQSGAICNYVAIKTDITERLRLNEERSHMEEQMRQAQKMESIGRLAGGVAHDFNNMLSIITGYAEIASDEVDEHDPLHGYLEQILDAGKRSRDLTRQLLAFARRQTVNPRVVDLNEVLSRGQKMLARLIGEDIDLRLMSCDSIWPIRLDPSQVDQIIANLAVNARDAISGVGGVIIETANVCLDEDFCANHVVLEPGDYVRLNFSDTGVGMDRDTLEKVFEPFFTTKQAGAGTGLGLSTVYGIVRQAGGLVEVYSEPGQGTTFKIYLPRCDRAPDAEVADQDVVRLTGTETVMVVEDEVQILELCQQVLRRAGYQVIIASQPGEALILAEKHPGDIHLLVTDVVMPSMNGKELKERLEQVKPGIRVLYMSGYTANIIAHRGVLAEGVEFLQKPFATRDLAKKVRQSLDRG